ncbi:MULTISPECIES: hypothetical protein [Streptomyces]|nr:hypothetical protein [Streptomyces canarius]
MMETQHQSIDRSLFEVSELLREWRSTGRGGEELADAFELLLSVLLAHTAMTFGMAMYEGDPEVVKAVLAHAPLPVRLLVPVIGRRRYAAHARRVPGTSRPARLGSLV